MSEEKVYQGSCFCGSVQYTVRGAPVDMGYCHCESCRRWSAAPVNAFSLWQPDAVTVTRGVEHIGIYNKTRNSSRKWCTVCGGHVFTDHPGVGLTDVYVANLPSLAFRPTVHVNYPETRLPMRDGLPKMRDFPRAIGGSGITVPE